MRRKEFKTNLNTVKNKVLSSSLPSKAPETLKDNRRGSIFEKFQPKFLKDFLHGKDSPASTSTESILVKQPSKGPNFEQKHDGDSTGESEGNGSEDERGENMSLKKTFTFDTEATNAAIAAATIKAARASEGSRTFEPGDILQTPMANALKPSNEGCDQNTTQQKSKTLKSDYSSVLLSTSETMERESVYALYIHDSHPALASVENVPLKLLLQSLPLHHLAYPLPESVARSATNVTNNPNTAASECSALNLSIIHTVLSVNKDVSCSKVDMDWGRWIEEIDVMDKDRADNKDLVSPRSLQMARYKYSHKLAPTATLWSRMQLLAGRRVHWPCTCL